MCWFIEYYCEPRDVDHVRAVRVASLHGQFPRYVYSDGHCACSDVLDGACGVSEMAVYTLEHLLNHPDLRAVSLMYYWSEQDDPTATVETDLAQLRAWNEEGRLSANVRYSVTATSGEDGGRPAG